MWALSLMDQMLQRHHSLKMLHYQDVTIAEENYFPKTKIIANQLNEINRMSSVKSFTMELDLDLRYHIYLL